MVAPEVMPYEIGNALSAMMKRRRLTQEQVQASFNILETIPLLTLDQQMIDTARSLNIKLMEV